MSTPDLTSYHAVHTALRAAPTTTGSTS